ncbi:MAG: LysR family transcriptional regulator [Lautropia sp.]
MNITLKQVDAFLAVARTASFSKGAKLVHLSQPALSATIRRLEEAVGARLFDRSTRTVSLSAVGREFQSIAADLLQNVDQSLNRIQSFVLGKRGRLVVAVAPSVATGFAPRVLSRFIRAHSDVEIDLHDVLADDCIEMVRAGAADLAITPKRNEASDLGHIELFRDHLVVLCADDHPLARRRTVNWKDISGYDHIAKNTRSSVRQLVDAEYKRQGSKLRPIFEVEHLGTMIGLISEGLGIGILPFSLLHAIKMDGLAWRTFSPANAPFRTICAVTLLERSAPPPVESFVRLCLQEAASYRRKSRAAAREPVPLLTP